MITIQPNPCWIVVFPNSDAWEEPHFDSEADAQSEANDRNERDDEEGEEPTYGVRQLDHLCVTAACSGCKKNVGDDDFDWVHFPDTTMAAEMAREADFFVDGLDVWCDNCRDVPHPIVEDPQAPGECLRCKTWQAEEHLAAVTS